MPDFRAAERVFQLMTQVSGRAGRGELPGRVVVQTYYPDHYAIVAASTHDYAAFAERELKYRRWMHYPPFGVLANVLVQSEKLEEAAGWSGRDRQVASRDAAPEGIRVLGPCTAPIARIKNVYRFHLILKAASRKALNAALRGVLAHADEAGIPRRNLVVDVDAQRSDVKCESSAIEINKSHRLTVAIGFDRHELCNGIHQCQRQISRAYGPNYQGMAEERGRYWSGVDLNLPKKYCAEPAYNRSRCHLSAPN